MTLEMPDVEQKPKKGRTPAERKAAQAKAHAKWRASEKGKAYLLRQKIKKAGLINGQVADARGHAFTEGCGCGACQQDKAEREANQ